MCLDLDEMLIVAFHECVSAMLATAPWELLQSRRIDFDFPSKEKERFFNYFLFDIPM